jgi:O-antigen/teichoic acid export membrane protein
MRTKNTLKTFLYGILMTSIIAVLGLVKTKCLLTNLGEEYVSVYQLFYQLFTYLSLVDGGIGASITYHLYKPIHEKDTKKINSIYTGAKYYFRIVGIIVIILGILLSFGIMFLIKETTIAAWYIKICFILFIISSALSYFTVAHALLYEAEQKLYKSSNLNHLLSIAEGIVVIVVSSLGGKLLLILTIFLFLSIIKNIILVKMSKKEHKYIETSAKKDLSFKKEANNLIVSKVNTLINENIDVVILSKFVGLGSVFIYTAYNQIVNMIKLMVQRLNSALLPSVGNLFVAEKSKAKATFNELNALLFFIGSMIFAPLLYMLTPFIGLWYGGEYTVNLFVSLLFVSVLFINIVKISLETYIKAAGEFASVKYASIYQCIVNVALSLILVHKFGIAGVLGATVFAFVTGNFIHYPRIIAKKITDDKAIYYYLKCLKYLFGLALNVVICYFVFKVFTINNLLMWLLVGVIIFVLNAVLTVGYYVLTKENLFFARMKRLIKKQ